MNKVVQLCCFDVDICKRGGNCIIFRSYVEGVLCVTFWCPRCPLDFFRFNDLFVFLCEGCYGVAFKNE
jgi:hypothetical protein